MAKRDLFVVEISKPMNHVALDRYRADIVKQLNECGVPDPIVLVVDDGTWVVHNVIDCPACAGTDMGAMVAKHVAGHMAHYRRSSDRSIRI